MASGIRVTDIDRGWAKMMSSFMNLDDKNSVCIGPDPQYIMSAEPKASESGKNRRNAKGQFTGMKRSYYPFFLEYGTRFMRARPFMRWTFDAHDNYRVALRKLAENVFEGSRKGTIAKSSMPALNEIASEIVKDIRTTIQGMGLIDTGRLYRSISLWRWKGA